MTKRHDLQCNVVIVSAYLPETCYLEMLVCGLFKDLVVN